MAITPTTITSEEQIYLTGSPINLRIRNLAADSHIKSVVLELYIWSGNLNAPPSTANYTLVADKVSKTDDYINFQIAEIVRSHITGTKFAFQTGDNAPSVSGEGVFFQYKYQVTNDTAVVETAFESLTNFATLGWRFDYEQVGDIAGSFEGQPYLGLIGNDYDNRNYISQVNYYARFFDFAQSLGTCTSESIITSTKLTPEVTKCQKGDKYIVAYINRLGLWDYFTPYGKAIKSVKVDADTLPKLYRNPNSVNNNVNHSKSRVITGTDSSYVLNTGDLNEKQVFQVEEVIYSPMVYLLEFTGETFTVAQEGLTVDSTTVTVDSTLYTVDEDTVTVADFGYYSNYKQIPVTNQNNSFVKKTRLNDKGKINYDLNFDSTVGRINNLR